MVVVVVVRLLVTLLLLMLLLLLPRRVRFASESVRQWLQALLVRHQQR